MRFEPLQQLLTSDWHQIFTSVSFALFEWVSPESRQSVSRMCRRGRVHRWRLGHNFVTTHAALICDTLICVLSITVKSSVHWHGLEIVLHQHNWLNLLTALMGWWVIRSTESYQCWQVAVVRQKVSAAADFFKGWRLVNYVTEQHLTQQSTWTSISFCATSMVAMALVNKRMLRESTRRNILPTLVLQVNMFWIMHVPVTHQRAQNLFWRCIENRFEFKT